MSCTDPINSIDALIQRAIRYSTGCGVLKYAETEEEGAFTCDHAELPDLVLLAMAFDSSANVFRVAITNAAIGDLCDEYDLRINCAGVTASQALRETITVDTGVATIRVLFVTGATGDCLACEDTEIGTEQMVGGTVVTDGTDSYILAIAPEESPDDLDCITAEVGAQTFVRSALSQVGSCGMWAWKVEAEDLEGGDFSDDFSDDFFT